MTQDHIPSVLVAATLAVVGAALVLARRLSAPSGDVARRRRSMP